jgi:hypothetical protein
LIFQDVRVEGGSSWCRLTPCKTARIWDAATGKEITALRGHQGYVEYNAPSRLEALGALCRR